MNIRYLSFVCVFLDLFHQYLVVLFWLNLSLNILLFLVILEMDCFLYLSNNLLYTTDFCVFILFAVNSLNLLIRSNRFFFFFFLWSLQDFIYVKLYHPQIANFTSSFLIVMSFISFSCLIAVTRSSRTMLSRRNGSGHSCLFLDLKGKAFNLSPWNMILTVGL